jgi:secreted PhoX family phosphatase
VTSISRRDFLARASAAGGSALFAPSLAGLAAFNDRGHAQAVAHVGGNSTAGYGSLIPCSELPELLVPRGFTCVKLSETRAPSRADPKFIVPGAFDGMAAFSLPNGNVRLIRNHEIRGAPELSTPFGRNAYDERAGGGTTSLEIRMEGGGSNRQIDVVAEYASLTGTLVNCAGGSTPWGSWLSCEETTEGTASGRLKDHGYIFEVPVKATSEVEPVPLKAMGRFVHEAVAVDPRTGFVYETEDAAYAPATERPGAGFYRFIPAQPGNLAAGGRLQALAVRAAANYNTTNGQRPARVRDVEWVDIDDPDPANAASDSAAVFRQGIARGAAIFQRLEGCWYGDGSIYFNATSGGNARAGQVWQYTPEGDRNAQLRGGGKLRLVFESPGAEVLDSPDNICVSPRGGLVLCEDGASIQFIRGLSRDGEIFDLVRTAGPWSEFAGSCFSPDGQVMFFNTQGSSGSITQVAPAASERGATYALWGPWETGAL